MKINRLEIGQLVSDGESISEVKFSEEFNTKYYCYERDQEEEDEDNEDIIFVTDMDEDYIQNAMVNRYPMEKTDREIERERYSNL
jgi:hypothetical protein